MKETLKAFDPRHKNSKRKGRKWERGKNLKRVTQIRRLCVINGALFKGLEEVLS